jgi:hypothetical protein
VNYGPPGGDIIGPGPPQGEQNMTKLGQPQIADGPGSPWSPVGGGDVVPFGDMNDLRHPNFGLDKGRIDDYETGHWKPPGGGDVPMLPQGMGDPNAGRGRDRGLAGLSQLPHQPQLGLAPLDGGQRGRQGGSDANIAYWNSKGFPDPYGTPQNNTMRSQGGPIAPGPPQQGRGVPGPPLSDGMMTGGNMSLPYGGQANQGTRGRTGQQQQGGAGNNPTGPGGQSTLMPPQFGQQPWESGAHNAYQATLGTVNDNINQGVSQAMSEAGFGGNRYSTAAMRSAGEVGAREMNRANSEFMGNMFGAGENAQNRALTNYMGGLDRSLAATGMDLENQRFLTGLDLDNQQQNRQRYLQAMQQMGDLSGQDAQNWAAKLGMLGGFGGQENQRMDEWQRAAYGDYEQNKYGSLPMLGQLMGRSTNPGQATSTQQQNPHKGPSTVDYAMQLATIAAMFYGGGSDARLKTEIVPVAEIGGIPIVSYKWIHSGEREIGVLAQDVELVAPAAVVEVNGIKRIKPRELARYWRAA